MIKYIDETDKSYGLAGMAIVLAAYDAEERIQAIDLDAPADCALEMDSEFYLSLAPQVGAKAIWKQAAKRFQLIAAMTVGNVACREIHCRGHRSLSGDSDSELRRLLADEARELCGYEPDEVSRLYGQALAYSTRLFSHPGVGSLADTLSRQLLTMRRIEADEVLSLLAPLNRM